MNCSHNPGTLFYIHVRFKTKTSQSAQKPWTGIREKVKEHHVSVENLSIHKGRKRAEVNRNQYRVSSLTADTRHVVINGTLFKDVVQILE